MSRPDTLKLMLIAGEPSGDLQGAHLANSLRARSSHLQISGMGGELMREAGVKIFASVTDLAVIGFFEVFKNIGTFKKIFDLMVKKLEEEKPHVVVLIDYPGFNLRFAREVKKRNIPLIYYISPQVWAWGKKRVKLIKKLVDRVIVIFRFEEEFYRRQGVPVSFVGHPLLDIIEVDESKEEIFRQFHLAAGLPLISLLPGSRENEVKQHLPIMLKVARRIKDRLAKAQFAILRSPYVKEEVFRKIAGRGALDIPVIAKSHYGLIKYSELALVSSGTATIEAAILRTPMIILYRVSFLSWLILRPLVRVPHLGMVNIVGGKEIVPEYLQYRARVETISNEALLLLQDEEKRKRMRAALTRVGEELGEQGAAQRAAEIILGLF